MMKKTALAALLGAATLLAACGQADDGSPTAAENDQLNNISSELDVDASADSLVVEDPALGNGEAGASGELPVVGSEAANDAAANTM